MKKALPDLKWKETKRRASLQIVLSMPPGFLFDVGLGHGRIEIFRPLWFFRRYVVAHFASGPYWDFLLVPHAQI
jgi:hypothetical protein